MFQIYRLVRNSLCILDIHRQTNIKQREMYMYSWICKRVNLKKNDNFKYVFDRKRSFNTA